MRNFKLNKRIALLILIMAIVIVSILFAVLYHQTKSKTNVETINMTGQPSGIYALEDGSLIVTDISQKVIWKVTDDTPELYSGYLDDTTVRDVYEEPVGGYNDASKEQSLYLEPWSITPYLNGFAIADTANGEIRILHPDHVETANIMKDGVRRVAGERSFTLPSGTATDEEGNIYVTDAGTGIIWKIDEIGYTETIYEGLTQPTGLFYKDGTLYICESGANRICKLEDGALSVVAGTGEDGDADGTTESACFSNPQGIYVDDSGVIYISDTGNSAVKQINGNKVSTLLSYDATGGNLYPISPRGLTVVGETLYVCDCYAGKIIKISL